MTSKLIHLALVVSLLSMVLVARPPESQAAEYTTEGAALDRRQTVSDSRLARPGVAKPPHGISREVLLGGVGCSFHGELLLIDFKATGRAVEGLQRSFQPGSSNFLYFETESCPTLVREIHTAAVTMGCQAYGEDGDWASFCCHGERDEIIGVVAVVLRIAVSEAAVP